jgi:hypothetical protein
VAKSFSKGEPVANHSRAPNPLSRDGLNTPADANGAILRLSRLAPFAEGGNRVCFVHPRHPHLCVKITRPGCGGKALLAKRAFRRRLFYTAAGLDRNLREFAEYRRLAKIGGEKLWRHIPRHFGFINTDLGAGAVTELVRNNDGSIASKLSDFLRRNGQPIVALKEFAAFLREKSAPFWHDPNFNNLVCAHLTGDGERIFIVDGLERKPRLPAALSPSKRHRQVPRKLAKFQALLAETIAGANSPPGA